jgi:hypothetical protein
MEPSQRSFKSNASVPPRGISPEHDPGAICPSGEPRVLSWRFSVADGCDSQTVMRDGLAVSKMKRICWGTDGSNPSLSSRQSVSRPHPLSSVENPGFPRGCARLAWRPRRQRRAGCFDIAPTGGIISVGPYSSTAVPLMGSARMPRCTQRSWAFTGLILVVR